MKRMLAFYLVALAAVCVHAEETQVVFGTLDSQVLTVGSRKVVILAPDGKTLWEHTAGGLLHDAWMLPSGNVLYADGKAVTEVTRDHKVVFEYKPKEQKGGGSYSCQRLADGKTLIGENSTGRVLEVDAQGKITFELQTSPAKPGNHHNQRMVRKLANGNYLVCHSGAKRVKEYTPKGEVVLDIPTKSIAFAAVRAANGHTFVCSIATLTEHDAAGKVVWTLTNKDVPDVTITNMTGFQLLANGNLVIGCYGAYNKDKTGNGLVEVTRDKKLVWRYANPGKGSPGRSMMAVQKLDAQGKPLEGECLR
ncbi:hypothetical protein HQ560_15305 [bacterium]|nr:hypothetical protein [bacterium]